MTTVAPPLCPPSAGRVSAFTYCQSGSWNIRLNEPTESLAYLNDHHGLSSIIAQDGESCRDLRYRGLAEMRRRGISPAEGC